MKIVRTLLIILGLLIVAFIIVSLLAPNEFKAERSILIDAPRSVTYSSVNNLQKWEHWEPWRGMDTSMTMQFGDTVAGTGAWYSWEGESMGRGKLTISESTPYEQITTQLNFYEQGMAESHFTFSDSSDMTKVTWDFYSEEGFPGNVFMWIVDVEGEIEKYYTKGLDSLKAHVEKLVNDEYRGHEIVRSMYPGNVFIGRRKTIGMDEMENFFMSTFAHAGMTINKNDWKISGSPAGLYFTWDEESKTSDMMAAIPLENKPASLPDTTMTIYEVPESKALKIEYFGSYDQIGEAHFGMEDFIKSAGMESLIKEPVIEEYVTDPSMQRDTSKWQTNIYYLLKGGN